MTSRQLIETLASFARIRLTDQMMRSYLRSNTSRLISGGSLSNISTIKASRPPKPFGTVNIDWSGINKTAVNNLRKKIKKYFDGKLTVIVYKRTASVDDMIFQKNVTELEKANVTEYLPHQDTCALIGNSGILLNSSCGREIDAHDIVVRANSAPTAGYERDVGYKTSLMMFNRASSLVVKKSMRSKPLPKSMNKMQMFMDFNDTIVWYALMAGGLGTSILKTAFSKLARDNIRVAYSLNSPMTISKRLWHLRLPSTGLNMISSMNYYCDKISLYGFFPFYVDEHGRRLQHHYYEQVQYNYTHSHHKMPYEFIQLTKLRDSGVLRLVTDRCY
ncbi:alpha-2,8-sialyltransferase 8B-like [Anneissia japonica]|uniref:alpha-2,8-sialyltransferase 8B-like n=1 Tax=Anneissia japonica TaxID=1529436 RepID=UPI001425AD3B|nr:alpha-2,8-sialyltransferase 8B-like [Anneissia japonica]